VPPLLAGAVNATLAVVMPVAVAVPIVGAPGTVNGVILLLALLAELVPTELVAVTVNVYAVPRVNPGTLIVPDPACDNVPVNPPGLLVAV
jgi:hypothetical protein